MPENVGEEVGSDVGGSDAKLTVGTPNRLELNPLGTVNTASGTVIACWKDSAASLSLTRVAAVTITLPDSKPVTTTSSLSIVSSTDATAVWNWSMKVACRAEPSGMTSMLMSSKAAVNSNSTSSGAVVGADDGDVVVVVAADDGDVVATVETDDGDVVVTVATDDGDVVEVAAADDGDVVVTVATGAEDGELAATGVDEGAGVGLDAGEDEAGALEGAAVGASVGAVVGASVCGPEVGAVVTGPEVGADVGANEGALVLYTGAAVGAVVGDTVSSEIPQMNLLRLSFSAVTHSPLLQRSSVATPPSVPVALAGSFAAHCEKFVGVVPSTHR
mmetsp:Transcript_8532/g.16151  ORF Transcript_8532/g.16151 Transcript_8532/m.16151 type:complete len:331 (-) Transcript_8532:1517-2509(-)